MTPKQMQKEITKLTQRPCVSTDVAYLTQRLAYLRQRAADGVRMPNTPREDESAVVSASLTRRRRDLLAKASAEQRKTVSSIVRDALDVWFAANGYRVEIHHIVATEVHGGNGRTP